MRPRFHLLLVLLVLAGLGGCGGAHRGSTRLTTPTTSSLPVLATRPPATGEIVIRGEGSPETKGPYTFDGRYLVRFEQYAPEDPKLDFAGQTAFGAELTVTANDPRGALKLFETAAASGRKRVQIKGRRYLDVTFGDFPWVIRFTPRGS